MKAADSFAGPAGEQRARRLHECGLANPSLNPEQKVLNPDAIRKEPNEWHDGAGLNGVERLLLDHFTVSWAADESLSVCRSRFVTVQWSTIEAGPQSAQRSGPALAPSQVRADQGRDSQRKTVDLV